MALFWSTFVRLVYVFGNPDIAKKKVVQCIYAAYGRLETAVLTKKNVKHLWRDGYLGFLTHSTINVTIGKMCGNAKLLNKKVAALDTKGNQTKCSKGGLKKSEGTWDEDCTRLHKIKMHGRKNVQQWTENCCWQEWFNHCLKLQVSSLFATVIKQRK